MKLIISPSDLVEFPAGDIRVFPDDSHSVGRVLELRRASRIDPDNDMRHSVNVQSSIQPSSMDQSLRGSDVSGSSIARGIARARSDIDSDIDFERAGPISGIRDLAAADVSSAKMLCFLYTGLKLSAIR